MGIDWRAPRIELTGRAEHGALLPPAAGMLRGALRGGAWLHPSQLEPATPDADVAAATLAARAARLRAPLLSGPPSALLHYALAAPADGWKPRAVQASGEGLGEDRRARLESAIGAPVFDAWRTRELGEAGHECDARNGLHVTMERVLIEILRDGQPVSDGEDGEIVATVLDNRAYPMFRVKTGDIGCRIPEPACACGRTSERILLTDGRADELVTTPAGRRIHGDWFEWLIETMVDAPDAPRIADWRVVQAQPDAAVIEVVPAAPWSEAERARVEAALAAGARDADPALALELRIVDAVPRRADGRRRAVVSSVPLAWDAAAPVAATPAFAEPHA
jgi:phenylacetate-CoA ligase